LTELALQGGTLTTPASLPFSLGTVPADGSVVLDANFSGVFEDRGFKLGSRDVREVEFCQLPRRGKRNTPPCRRSPARSRPASTYVGC
jgi:hypothetical protein